MKAKKEVYVPPVLTKHGLLRNITAAFSGGHGGGAIKTVLEISSAGLPRVTRTATKTVSWLVNPCWTGQPHHAGFCSLPHLTTVLLSFTHHKHRARLLY